MQTGKIIRILDLGVKIQILCADERGLLSVYFEHRSYYSFLRAVQRAGLKLNGLLINFNKDVIRVPALGKEYTLTRRKWCWLDFLGIHRQNQVLNG